MTNYTFPVIIGVIFGMAARLYMLRTDYRQYPTYIHGQVIHIALGFIASGLGAIIMPALIQEEFTAITFLTLAATQFRDVRNMERNTLTQMDSYELVSRGSTYIEGIAIAFESRNYIAILTALIVTSACIFFSLLVGTVVGIICVFVAKILMSGSQMKDIADIEKAELRFDGAGLYVNDIYIMNIGLPEKQKLILEHGMGFILNPKNFNAATTIANLGQRQAVLFDLSNVLGVYRDSGEPSLSPLAKRDLNKGTLGVFILPQLKREDLAIRVLEEVPILENAIRMPTEFIKKKAR
ncbi:YIEGIA family protein [Bacillus sp. 179-C3.3 HS]|uniref:YIEGIA family protein n=1 Tax=Bacillus sp. 179-C3.3 HS TaxID=3232162 RepID=UPI00399F3824